METTQLVKGSWTWRFLLWWLPRTATATTSCVGCGLLVWRTSGTPRSGGTLRRLFNAGALTSYVVPSEEGPHRKYYGINGQGRHMLELQARRGAASAPRWRIC